MSKPRKLILDDQGSREYDQTANIVEPPIENQGFVLKFRKINTSASTYIPRAEIRASTAVQVQPAVPYSASQYVDTTWQPPAIQHQQFIVGLPMDEIISPNLSFLLDSSFSFPKKSISPQNSILWETPTAPPDLNTNKQPSIDNTQNFRSFPPPPPLTTNKTSNGSTPREPIIKKEPSIKDESSYSKKRRYQDLDECNLPPEFFAPSAEIPPSSSLPNPIQSNDSENSTTQSGLIPNKTWHTFLSDKRLYWANHINFPLEITILLNILKDNYGGKPVKTARSSYKSERIKEVVSEPHPLTDLINEYKGNDKLRRSLERNIKGFPVYRMIRDDGNCFYRAFICGYLEMALTSPSCCYFMHLLFEFSRLLPIFTTDCTDQQILPASQMFHFLMHRLLQLYTYRTHLSQSRDPQLPQKIISLFYQMLNEKPFQFDMYLIVAMRSYVKALVEVNTKLDSIGKQNAINDVMTYGLECDDNEVVIVELCNALKVRITLLCQQTSSVVAKEMEPVGFRDAAEVVLFFRPGHYDLIYNEAVSKVLYAEEVDKTKRQTSMNLGNTSKDLSINSISRY